MIDGTRQGPEDPQSIPTNIEGLAYYLDAPSIRRADKLPRARLMPAPVFAIQRGQIQPVISAGLAQKRCMYLASCQRRAAPAWLT